MAAATINPADLAEVRGLVRAPNGRRGGVGGSEGSGVAASVGKLH